MRKITILLFGFLIGFQCFGQDPELFRTWNLYKIEIKWSNGLLISEVDPPISPWLTINEALEFNGFGACNEFSGNFIYLPSTDRFDPINYNETLSDCETEFHDAIEDEYFGYFKWPGALYYFLYTDTDDKVHLVLSKGSPGFQIDFVSEQLSVNSYLKNEFKIFPNPVSDQLFISSEKLIIKTLSVFSTTGQRILEIEDASNPIDVSSLSKGMYFLEIDSEEGKSVQKFMKQ